MKNNPPNAKLKEVHYAKEGRIRLFKELNAENKGNQNISYDIIKRIPKEDVFESSSNHSNSELIKMRIKGATGLTKILIGSNAAPSRINIDIPAITVPEYARFNGIKNIINAGNMWDLKIKVASLIPLAAKFNYTNHLVHINIKQNTETEKRTDLIKDLNYFKIKLKVAIT